MGTITLARKKSFVGMVIKYYSILNMSREELFQHLEIPATTAIDNLGSLESSVIEDIKGILDVRKFESKFLNASKQVSVLANGDSVTIELDESPENRMFVIAMTSSGLIFSNQITVHAGKSYAITTKFGLKATKITIGEL